jgi:hypothetical protein
MLSRLFPFLLSVLRSVFEAYADDNGDDDTTERRS